MTEIQLKRCRSRSGRRKAQKVFDSASFEEILKEILTDEAQLKDSNETFQQLTAAQRGEEVVDPLATWHESKTPWMTSKTSRRPMKIDENR